MSFVRIKNNFVLHPRFEHQDSHNPESAPNFTTDPRSTVVLKSANPLDSVTTVKNPQSVRIIIKAKSVNPKTYSSPLSKPSILGLHARLSTLPTITRRLSPI